MEELSVERIPRDPLTLAQLRVAALMSVIEDPTRRPGMGPHVVDEAKRRALAAMGLSEATE